MAPLPPQVGGVASVAEWLLAHEDAIGCTYVTFDLVRRPGDEMGGRFRLLALPRQLRLLARFLFWLRRSPQVVHYCVSTSKPGLARDALYIGLLKLARRRTIAHIHGAYLAVAAASPYRSRLLQLVSRSTSERVAISPTSRRILESIDISSRAILNPLRMEPEAEASANGAGRSVTLLFVGAYGRRKGCPELVDAVAELIEQGAAVSLRIVGMEDHRGDDELVRERIRHHGLDGAVEFAGVLHADALVACYRDADILCLPSRAEGLPMALIEAMAFSLPVIATPVGGIPDLVVDGETGFLVPPGDAEQLARAIAKLADDLELRRRMGQRGRERVLSLAGSSTIASQWRALYGELTDEIAA